MHTPFYATHDNLPKYYAIKKEVYKYCFICQRDTFKSNIYCKTCLRKLVRTGLEEKRVTLYEVGVATIPYQQYLHTSFFNCNVHLFFRGKKEERIKAKLPKQLIDKATTDLRNLLSRKTYVWNNKRKPVSPHLLKLVSLTKDVRNINKRLLYNILLFHISYHIDNNKDFKSYAHFQASYINHIFIHLYQTANRTKNHTGYKFRHNIQFHYYFYEETKKLVLPLLNKLISNLYS